METTTSGDLGCMVCLLRVGLDDAEESENKDEAFAPLPDQFGPYTIARHEDGSPWELGRGAMGVTYRAVDTTLQRSVALKIINTDLASRSAEARERFIREARLAASLRHPNVATVHHFGIREETGQCFCAMELVEGETLDERVRRMGPLDVRTVVEIACQIAAALTAAEKRGLVHRDLKPANVMIATSEESDSIAIKVIDFGVAKALAETPDARVLTHTGFIGTPAFASPEQFANAPVDTRSDIYSLGATLWYLLTGHMPFGDRVLPKIRQDRKSVAVPTEQLKAARVPSRLIALLVSMLSIEPAARPGVRDLATRLGAIHAQLPNRGKTARRVALAAGLIALTAVAALFVFHPFGARVSQSTGNVPEKSITVLPFENQSSDKENAFFADGIQDDVLTSLAKIGDLKVIGRTSVMSYRNAGTRNNLREIGEALGVGNLLEGSVRRVGDRVRVSTRLIDAHTERQIWAESYDRALRDSLTLQGEIAREIALTLRAKLSTEEKAGLEAKPTNNSEAYLLYLRGLEREGRIDVTIEDFIAADQLYAQAIALDPTFALARARASINSSAHPSSFLGDPARASKARREAEEALRLAPTLGQAHLALGLCFYRAEGNFAAALNEFFIASTALPNDPEILKFAAWIYRRQGRWHEAIASYKRAQEIDPRNVDTALEAAVNYLRVRDWPAAAEAANRGLAAEPNYGHFLVALGFIELVRNGNLAAMEAFYRQIPASFEWRPCAMWELHMLKRDFDMAAKISETINDAEDRSIRQACTALARGDVALAHRLFEAMRPALEAKVREIPDDAERHASLGEVDAYLGRKEDAIRESRRAVELVPESKNAFIGPRYAGNLALVYAWTGEEDQAIALIERLLSTPGAVTWENATSASITLAELRLRWEWDPLRSNPRFQKILAGPEPKTIY